MWNISSAALMDPNGPAYLGSQTWGVMPDGQVTRGQTPANENTVCAGLTRLCSWFNHRMRLLINSGYLLTRPGFRACGCWCSSTFSTSNSDFWDPTIWPIGNLAGLIEQVTTCQSYLILIPAWNSCSALFDWDITIANGLLRKIKKTKQQNFFRNGNVVLPRVSKSGLVATQCVAAKQKKTQIMNSKLRLKI